MLKPKAPQAAGADQGASPGGTPGGTPGRADADAAAPATPSPPTVTAGSPPGRLPLHQALRCSLCDYRTPFFADMSRHMASVHGNTKGVRVPPTLQQAVVAKRPAKPLPNLIPIQATALAQPRTTPTPAAPPAPAPANGTAVNGGPSNADDAADTSKKKNSFFDQLKLYPGNVEGSELVCVHCGHEAKCVSELVRHTKLHQGTGRGIGTSTRCQHCRHRCKTSADLTVHLKACPKAAAAAAEAEAPAAEDAAKMDVDPALDDEGTEAAAGADDAALDRDSDDEVPAPSDDTVPRADSSLVGVETAPGYGLVTHFSDWAANAKCPRSTTFTPRKVYKCPDCTFWASTASRFHVHMVGHLNKKPFACSVCKYRSNWRWDISKHIRLKEVRDASHVNAKTLMTDETGRRNYSKYNLDLLWLKIAEPDTNNVHSMLSAIKPVSATQAETGQSVSTTKMTVLPTLSKAVPTLSAPPKAGAMLPAPPKLTRAPVPRITVQPATPLSLRPPPPLQAASGAQNSSQVLILQSGVRTQTQGQQLSVQPQQSMKRPADTPVPNVGSDPKKSNTDIKRTVWRCKQCHFRDGDRAVVLSHVKGHYRQQQEAAQAKSKNTSSGSQEPKSQEPQQSLLKKAPFRCDTCPFVSVSESLMQSHVNCHKQRDDVFFKCFYCPFYVASKEEVIQHMTVHQQNSKGESSNPSSVKSPIPRSSAATPSSQSPSSNHPVANKAEVMLSNVQVKKEVESDQVSSSDREEEVQPPNQALGPPVLDFLSATEAPLCWVLRDGKLQKMLRCRYCPHVNLRRTNMQEHERMHSKRSSLSSEETGDNSSQYSPYPCPDCSYVCNNAGVLSSHMKVHFGSYPQAYAFHDPYRSELLQMKEVIDKYKLKIKTDDSSLKTAPPKDPVDAGNENKLSGINVMSLLDPNQSLTDAVLAMKKKFNLELDGEPFAEPVEDSAESPPCSPLKQLNDGADPSALEMHEEKQLHFCFQCPARFLFRKELGIHSRFHNLYLIHKCDHCTYTARQRPHLQAHSKVHSEDYQDRTNALLKMYSVHKEFPKPRIVCVNHKAGVPGTLWIVVNTDYQEPPAPTPNFVCGKCPASFYKTDAHQAHLALHGSNNPHKCPICDYAVRTYGNLVKHMVTHGCRASVAKKILMGRMKVPESLLPPPVSNAQSNDTVEPKEEPQSFDSEEQEDQSHSVSARSSDMDGGPEVGDENSMDVDEKEENDNEGKSEDKGSEDTPSKSPPPQNTGFASGSPEFVYPTYCRNGRVKVKRFKCQKCPSAFEKKDQYLVHTSLHGSKQKYKCTKCDYSVKFFANHIQHLRRHQLSEDAKSKDDPEPQTVENEDFIPEDTENIPSPPVSPTRSAKTTGGKGEKLSVADKQAIMVLQQRRAKRAAISRESLDKNYWCSHCPYSSVRRDQVESHMRRHIAVSGVRNAYVCDHCDYSVPIKHFLRDHSKLHFDVSKAPRPDAYMICDGLELWASSGFTGKNKAKGKVLIFQDKGATLTTDRFLPPLSTEENEDSSGSMDRIYVNPRTFESENVNEVGAKDTIDTSGEVENEEEGDSYSRKSEKSNDGVGKEGIEDVLASASCSFSAVSEMKSNRSNSPLSVKSVEN